jgi:hypothetical protein
MDAARSGEWLGRDHRPVDREELGHVRQYLQNPAEAAGRGDLSRSERVEQVVVTTAVTVQLVARQRERDVGV